MPTDNTNPHNALKKARTAAYLSRAALSALTAVLKETGPPYTHVSIPAIQGLESGRNVRPRPSTAITLATALNIDVEALFPTGLDSGNRLGE